MEQAKIFFSQRAITIATYFGGPLAAGYLIKKNYDTLEQPENAKTALTIGIISSVLIFAGIFSIPEHIIEKIPNALIPLIYTAIIYWIVEKIQGEILNQHKESGGVFYSGWKAAGIGAISMTVLLVFVAIIAFVSGDLSNKANFDTVTYDKELAKYADNEKKALTVFAVFDSSQPDYLIKELGKGVVLWKENRAIIERINTIENLPQDLLNQNKGLLKYCELRIQHNEIIIRALSEETDQYISEIERIGFELNKILEDLK